MPYILIANRSWVKPIRLFMRWVAFCCLSCATKTEISWRLQIYQANKVLLICNIVCNNDFITSEGAENDFEDMESNNSCRLCNYRLCLVIGSFSWSNWPDSLCCPLEIGRTDPFIKYCQFYLNWYVHCRDSAPLTRWQLPCVCVCVREIPVT